MKKFHFNSCNSKSGSRINICFIVRKYKCFNWQLFTTLLYDMVSCQFSFEKEEFVYPWEGLEVQANTFQQPMRFSIAGWNPYWEGLLRKHISTQVEYLLFVDTGSRSFLVDARLTVFISFSLFGLVSMFTFCIVS